jgi:hypothetical protein
MRTIAHNITVAPAKYFGPFDLVFNPVFLALILFFLSPLWGMISDLTTIAHPYYLVFIAIAIYFGIYVFNNKHVYFPIKEKISRIDMALMLFVLILAAFGRFSSWSDWTLLFLIIVGRICAPYFLGRLFVHEQIKQFIGYALPLSLLFNIGLILIELFYGPYNENARAFVFSKYVAYQTVGASVGYLLVATSVIELFHVYNSHFMRLINSCAIVSSVFVIVHMGARGMLSASLLVIFYICLFGNISRRYLILLLLIIFSLSVSFVALPQSRVEHFENLAEFIFPFIQQNTMTSNKSCEIRASYVGNTIDAVKKNPILGNGTGNFEKNNKFASPHSTFLQAFAELGIVGFAVFLILNIRFGVLFHRLITCRDNGLSDFPVNKVVAAMWAFTLVQDQFSGNYFNSIQYFFLSALLVTTSESAQGRSS